MCRQLSGVKAIRHPIAGAMTFEHMSFSIDDGSDMKLIVYTPLAPRTTPPPRWRRCCDGAAKSRALVEETA